MSRRKDDLKPATCRRGGCNEEAVYMVERDLGSGVVVYEGVCATHWLAEQSKKN